MIEHILRNTILTCTVIVIIAMLFLRYHQLETSAQVVGTEKTVRTDLIHAEPSHIEGSTTLLFVGDMFFDRYIRKMARLHGEDTLFSCIDPLFDKADAVIGNLEGPITDYDSVSEDTLIGSPENYRFTFSTSTATLLARHHINIVNLGNNHITNFGHEGIASTHQYLDQAGVGYFGGVVGEEPVYRNTIGGIPFSFVSYNAFYGTSSVGVAQQIVREKEAGRFVVLFAHWGEEYSTSTRTMSDDAHLFALQGAGLIVGAHPHVVLPHETIGATPTYYSLGNFMFDQYWNDAVRHGLVLRVEIHGDVITTSEYQVELGRDGRTCVVVSPHLK